ncbi:MAG: LysR family transcriptional regulator [Clostridia bacterium]|nr:LysR family transcriptional regulator [Clostridia bacterium]
MELLQLKYFCNAAQTQNFSKTAKKYQVPPSNISQTIRRLENELGVKLFAREANRIILNEHGKLFYHKIQSALSLIEDAKDELAESNDELRGTIHLLIDAKRWIVSSCISEFKKKHPLVTFRIDHSTVHKHGNYDFIISDQNPKQIFEQKILLLTEQLMIAMPKNHPLADKQDLTLADLSQEDFVAAKEDASLYILLMQLCAQQGFIPNITIQSEDTTYLLSYVDMGLGVFLVSSFYEQNLYSENIVLKYFGEHYRKTYVYCDHKKYLSPTKQCFLEELIQGFQTAQEIETTQLNH